jgi:hypothetical protein
VATDSSEIRALRRQHYELIVALAARVADSDASSQAKSQAEVARLEALSQLALANAPLADAALAGLDQDREGFFRETARVIEERPGTPEAAAAARLQVSVSGRYLRDSGASLGAWVKRFCEYACQQAQGKYPGEEDNARRDLASAANVAETAGETDSAVACFETWAKVWPNDPESKLVPATVNRLRSVGKPLELKGALYPKGDFDLATLKGKWVILHLWRSTPAGAEMMARLERQVEPLRARNCEVVGICLDQDDKQLAQLMANNRIQSQQLFEPYNGDLSKHPFAGQFGIAPAPFTILVDPEGKVAENNFRSPKLVPWVEKLMASPKK